MSYSIYYDRAFIRIDDKIIPLANSGSNNCWEFYNGRDVPEKSWNVMNWQRENQFLFTKPELRELAHMYDEYNQSSGMIFKSRSNCFKAGELERWIMNGINRAYTVEKYVSFGNSFYVLEYPTKENDEWKRHPFQTTHELLTILNELKGSPQIDIKIRNNREVIRPVAHIAPNKTPYLAKYFVLTAAFGGQSVYFVSLTKYGVKFTYTPKFGAKVFKTHSEAQRYLSKNQSRLQTNRIFFNPEEITADTEKTK